MMEATKYECEGQCDFWIILHGNEGNLDYRDERFRKCQNCQRPERIEAYKHFWQNRGTYGCSKCGD